MASLWFPSSRSSCSFPCDFDESLSQTCALDFQFLQLRILIEQAAHHGGGQPRACFFLVHVATPVEECEQRDRKGLYAKARRGEIPEFTGISSPYEAPTDADVVVDTTGRTIKDCLAEILEALGDRL